MIVFSTNLLSNYGNFLFADGSVRTLSTNMDLTVQRALATRAGGEAVGSEDD